MYSIFFVPTKKANPEGLALYKFELLVYLPEPQAALV